uniref:Amino acid transporter transmembrane domain-containing protein n=2 Tax=Kalmanozyma brasiliensis (strain GHG001) TaxID=1365824 RepID=V5GM15_KALBG
MPHFFARTGILIGSVALVGVAILGGVGGGLWVVLSRYVNGSSIEAIVGASFGRYTRWKGGLGRVISGLLLAIYATGSAIIGYFALANLLLQVFFNYSPKGVPLHDRGFVTLVVGGIISSPLVIFPLAKRNLIRLNTFFSLLFYPIIVTIILVEIYAKPHGDPSDGDFGPRQLDISDSYSTTGSNKWPNMNPFSPPSIWAPISLLPLLTLSACPPQILAHQRSLRRIGTSRSNVKAFLAAQAGQVTFIVVMGILFGVVAGVNGVQGRLHQDVHPNLFASLPTDDHWINVARVLFIAILVTHLAICLTTARSSWGRLLRLLNINPFRRRKAPIQLSTDSADTSAPSPSAPAADHEPASRYAKFKRTWGKPARNALAGALLWSITASSAYLSGVGGFRRSEREGEEARFTRASEVLGLMGAAVGFVMPGLVWLIAFHIRRPRAILPPFASNISKAASAYFSGPLSMLARSRLFGRREAGELETQPLLEGEEDEVRPAGSAPAHSIHSRHSSLLGEEAASIPSHLTEQTSADRDEATTILLARKERQLQKKTRGRRIWQDIVVFAGVLPFGFALLVLGAVELRRGGY